MSDDHSQRPYRANQVPGRHAPSGGNAGASSGNDPLAELARLIGQSDPFGEFGRKTGQAKQPEPAAPAQAYAPAQNFPPVQNYTRGQNHAPAQNHAQAEPYGEQDYGRPAYGSAPLAGEGDLYRTDADAHAYEQDHYDQDHAGHGHEDSDYYDEPPPRRRMGILAVAAVFALAVIGTAGAFGYRALFGSATSGPPPIIKADTSPSKIVPAKKDTASGKLINDRVAGDGAGEKLVPREEQPVEIKPTGVFPSGQAASAQPAPAQAGPASMPPPALGSGVVGDQPKKIHTIVIHPDRQGMTEPAAAPYSAPQRQMATPTPATPAEPTRLASASPAGPEPDSEAAPAPRHAAPRAARSAPGNAPLSLNPNAAPAAAPTRTAAAPARIEPPAARSAAASGAGGYAVQLSSRRSESDAQAAFRSLKAKFPGQLGSREPMIRKVDLGKKGVYYRAMVGPFGSADEASRLCSSLKSAGGSCFVQRI